MDSLSLPIIFFWGILLILLAEDSDQKYYLIEEAPEVDRFKIGDFSFFHLYGIFDYSETFKIWMRRFPRPVLIFAIREDHVISFIYIDPWEEIPFIANVLRAQETVERYRGKRIGYKMFLLGAALSPEYLITKPLTDKARIFYTRLGFVKAESISVFRNYHQVTGYLALPAERKNEHLEMISGYFSSLYL